MSSIPSHSLLQRSDHLRRVVARDTKHRNNMIKTMKKNFVHQRDVQKLCVKIDEINKMEVPPLVLERTNQVLKDNICWIVREELHKETKSVKDDFCSMVSQELATTVP
ncbi:hypothetical protein Tco_0839846 [Tanacetum coccineum]|uniref:Uncharacterized protein n=1 Tax=Tanacetum coccineum TaxID=301880 RepID=A0ABQ5AWB9_9ASTR